MLVVNQHALNFNHDQKVRMCRLVSANILNKNAEMVAGQGLVLMYNTISSETPLPHLPSCTLPCLTSAYKLILLFFPDCRRHSQTTFSDKTISGIKMQISTIFLSLWLGKYKSLKRINLYCL